MLVAISELERASLVRRRGHLLCVWCVCQSDCAEQCTHTRTLIDLSVPKPLCNLAGPDPHSQGERGSGSARLASVYRLNKKFLLYRAVCAD